MDRVLVGCAGAGKTTIDGNYGGGAALRYPRADPIIFLDVGAGAALVRLRSRAEIEGFLAGVAASR